MQPQVNAMQTQSLSALNLTQGSSAQNTSAGQQPVSGSAEAGAQSSFDEQLQHQVNQVSKPGKQNNSQYNQEDTSVTQVDADTGSGLDEPVVTRSIEVALTEGVMTDSEAGLQQVVQLDTHGVEAESLTPVVDVDGVAGDPTAGEEVLPLDLPPAGNGLPPLRGDMASQSGSVQASQAVADRVNVSVELQQGAKVTGQPLAENTRIQSQENDPQAQVQGRIQDTASHIQAAFSRTLLSKPVNPVAQTELAVPVDKMSLSEVMSQASRLQQVAATTAISSAQLSTSLMNHVTPAVTSITSDFSGLQGIHNHSAMTLQIQSPVHSQQWGQQMSEQVAMMIRGGQQLAEIRLNPAHLGPVEIKLSVQDDQASINFVANHAPVRDAIDSALPRLREMLEQQGLNLADVDVSAHSEQQASAEENMQGRNNNSSIESTENITDSQSESHQQIEIDSGVNLYA